MQVREEWFHAKVADAREAAKTCFNRALAIGAEPKARSWELRAATSLARLWHDQGKRDEAFDLLARVCGRIAEGFNTPELRDARTLLNELRG